MSADLSPRAPRADAERNRQRLLNAAKEAFAEKGATVSLEEIARRADLGIGTLYRHFPTRDALVEQVYRNETAQLGQAAECLAQRFPPVEALRRWLLLFVDYLTTKIVIAQALNGRTGGAADLYAASGAQLRASVTLLSARAVATGEIRLDVQPLDLLRAIAGIAYAFPEPGWENSARQLVDVLLAGLTTDAKGFDVPS